MPRFPIDSDWFKKKMQGKSLSQAQLGRLLDIDDTTVFRVLSGSRPITIYEAVKLARIFEVSLYDLLQGAGIELSGHGMTLPIVGSVNGAFDITPSAEYPPVTSIPLVEQSVVGLICNDRASPFYGLIFAYIPASDIEPSAIGRLSVAKLPSGKMLIRFLNPGLYAGKFDLAPLNGPPFTNFTVFTASPVLFIRPVHGS